jgi:phage baseplate assembly protein V
MSEVERLWRRVRMMVAPVKITATNDTGPVHRVQARAMAPETIDNLPVLQIYGLASHAAAGSDAVAIFIAGDRSNGMIVATGNQQFRLRGLQAGEVALYTDEGDVVKLARGRVVQITTGTKLEIVAPTVTITGKDGGKAVVNLTGDIHATGTITADTITAPHGHVGP